ncbi:MAG: aminotransferase class I/II-fold pyridoxal phosphate-dependent enzyme [Actinomycetota bacterium]
MPTARMERVARSTSSLFRFVETWDSLRQHPDVCDFTFGNPQELALPGFSDALSRQLAPRDKDWFAYKRSEPDAQAVVAKRLGEWRGMPFEPDDIALTPGAFGAIAVALSTLVDQGDEVVFSVPSWFFYEPMILGVGGAAVKVAVRPDDHDLDVEAIAEVITPRTRMVIVNTPNNPTGRIYPAPSLTRLAAILAEASRHHGAPIYLLSDEPYARLVFSDSAMVSPADFYPYTLISYSYGKVLLTPGQRLGWLALSPEMPDREDLRRLVQLTQMTGGWLFASALMQHAIDDLEDLSIDLADLEQKRNLMAKALRSQGYQLHLPEGTFYLWVRSPQPDDHAFAMRLASEKVLVLPGSPTDGPGYFRISLTATRNMIERSLPVFARAISG